jgi:hypothetical protein
VLERIYVLVASAETPKKRQDTLSSLAFSQASIGELQAAENTAEQLEPGQQREGVMMVIAMQRTKSDPVAALSDVLILSYESWRNTSLRGVADALAASGNYSKALATIDLIQGPGERAYALAELAIEQAKEQDPAAVQTVEMASEAALAGGAETKPYVFEFIAVTRGMLNDFAGAEEMIATMEDSSKVWPLWNLTEMLVRSGREEEAIALANLQTAAHPRAYALLGTATAMLDKQAAEKIAEATK